MSNRNMSRPQNVRPQCVQTAKCPTAICPDTKMSQPQNVPNRRLSIFPQSVSPQDVKTAIVLDRGSATATWDPAHRSRRQGDLLKLDLWQSLASVDLWDLGIVRMVRIEIELRERRELLLTTLTSVLRTLLLTKDLENVTWSENYGGWRTMITNSLPCYAMGFATSSTITFASCHILLLFIFRELFKMVEWSKSRYKRGSSSSRPLKIVSGLKTLRALGYLSKRKRTLGPLAILKIPINGAKLGPEQWLPIKAQRTSLF